MPSFLVFDYPMGGGSLVLFRLSRLSLNANKVIRMISSSTIVLDIFKLFPWRHKYTLTYEYQTKTSYPKSLASDPVLRVNFVSGTFLNLVEP